MNKTTIPTLKLTENALRVLEKRYLIKDDEGDVAEVPEDLFRRVAENIAKAEGLYDSNANLAEMEESFYQIMSALRFLPNSPTLMNAGRDLQQLSACFVLPVPDSMEGIFETLKQAAIIHKTGGGTGFSFSRIRPKHDRVKTTGGVASGPISFMKVFNHATEAVKQGGTRRGANMGILRVDHPDILDFISCKADTSEITNFNISVAMTEAFMEAHQSGEDYDLISPRTGQVVGQLSATQVMDKIAAQAWQTGEPGLFFIDEANRTNPTPHVSEIEATNPCGEQPLLPYESCNLGSIVLDRHLKEEDGKYQIDWTLLEETIRIAVRFLDNVIDMNRYPISEIEKITKANRKIGLGVMGFARMLFKLELPYNSDEGIKTAKELMAFIKRTGDEASARLAEERGVYPNWPGSLHEAKNQKLRNSYVTTIAPTGTISMIADTSGGCEPEFSLVWYKNVMDGEHLPYVLDYFIEIAKREGFYSEDLLDRVIENKGSVQGLTQVPEHWQKVFVTSHDIQVEWHVIMQAAFQEYSDSAVSKTINLPHSATVKDVKEAYLMAYTLGCKGITVYRDGSRDHQVLNVGTDLKGQSKRPGPESSLELTPELRVKVKTRHGSSYVHVAFGIGEKGMAEFLKILKREGRFYQLFLSPSPHIKNRESLDLICRLISDDLVEGKPIEKNMEQMLKSNAQFGDMSTDVYALIKSLAAVMSLLKNNTTMDIPCPECGFTPVRMQEGCLSCTRCSWSRC